MTNESPLRKIARQITEGILPALAEGELASERLKMCETCPHLRKLVRQCGACNCFVDLKAKLLNARCPIDKW